MTAGPAVFDHVLSDEDSDALPAGTYRVVGVSETTVALLRVGSPSASRVHIGEVRHVPIETYRFLPPAENPDNGAAIGTVLAIVGTAIMLAGIFTSAPQLVAVSTNVFVFFGVLIAAIGLVKRG